MPTSVVFKVAGLRELGEAMRTLKAETALKYARAATGAAAGVVKKAAVRNVQSSPSVRTGRLLKNVIAKRIPPAQTDLTSEHIVTVRGRGKTGGVSYAHFIEFGTVHMPAEPFLRPALEQKIHEAIEAMKRPLERGIIQDRGT